MAGKHIIPSVLNPKQHCYTDVDGWYDSGLLCWAFGKFDTYGDGTTKHSPVYRLGLSDFTDFCLSLAQYMVDHPEGLPCYAHDIGLEPISEEQYEFLLSVKHRENKSWQFYCPTLMKTSTVSDKRYDKRWFEVPTWANGTPKSAIQLYWHGQEGRGHLLRHYYVIERFRELAGGNFYGQDDIEIENWRKDIAGDGNYAWEAMKRAYLGIDYLQCAKRTIDCAVHNTQRRIERAAEEAAEKAAAAEQSAAA